MAVTFIPFTGSAEVDAWNALLLQLLARGQIIHDVRPDRQVLTGKQPIQVGVLPEIR